MIVLLVVLLDAESKHAWLRVLEMCKLKEKFVIDLPEFGCGIVIDYQRTV